MKTTAQGKSSVLPSNASINPIQSVDNTQMYGHFDVGVDLVSEGNYSGNSHGVKKVIAATSRTTKTKATLHKSGENSGASAAFVGEGDGNRVESGEPGSTKGFPLSTIGFSEKEQTELKEELKALKELRDTKASKELKELDEIKDFDELRDEAPKWVLPEQTSRIVKVEDLVPPVRPLGTMRSTVGHHSSRSSSQTPLLAASSSTMTSQQNLPSFSSGLGATNGGMMSSASGMSVGKSSTLYFDWKYF